jgi:serine/threonine protein phosphatase PrpC
VNEDRAAVMECGPVAVLAVADGAGGTGGGADAAEMVIRLVGERLEGPVDPGKEHVWAELLKDIDYGLVRDPGAGEAAAMLVAVSGDGLSGARAGDAGALLVTRDACTALAGTAHRKPLLGTGLAVPVSFTCRRTAGRVVVATDGLLKYAPAEKIAAAAREGTADEAAARLVDLVRLRSGALQDDIAVIVREV